MYVILKVLVDTICLL